MNVDLSTIYQLYGELSIKVALLEAENAKLKAELIGPLDTPKLMPVGEDYVRGLKETVSGEKGCPSAAPSPTTDTEG